MKQTEPDFNVSLIYLRRWAALIGFDLAIEKTREFVERMRMHR